MKQLTANTQKKRSELKRRVLVVMDYNFSSL